MAAKTEEESKGAPAAGGKKNMEGVFLTSMRDRDGVGAELEAMTRVKDLHVKIGSVVGHLNEKIALVLQKQEKEFLAAYRAHMLSVQKELQQLRAKANEAELAMKKNEKIRSLEDERNWYRKEALRLDKFATAMKKDLKYMKEKLESIEDDRKWLERQLKSSKKSNKLLRAELEIRMMQGDGGGGGGGGSRRSVADESEFAGGSGGEERKPMFPPPTRHHGGSAPSSPLGGSRSNLGSRGRDRGSRGLGRTSSDRRFSDAAEGPSAAQYQALLERAQSQLAAEKRMVKQLRAHAVAASTRHSELETFFIKCIADVKRDVSRRRTKATQRGTKARPGAAPRSPTPSAGASGRFDKDFGPDSVAIRAESPGLEDFTATDRRKVIRRLLSDDYVLQMLHQMIFGAGDEADLTAGPPDDAGAKFTGPLDAPADEDFDGSGGGMALDPTVANYLYGGDEVDAGPGAGRA